MKKSKLQKKCNELELRIKENTGWNKARVFGRKGKKRSQVNEIVSNPML
jgi:hypothetical protein